MQHTIVLKVEFAAARAGLVRLTREEWLTDVSDQAYSAGLTGLIRVGPLGDAPGAGKLVRVLMLDPVDRDGACTLPLRWEATGVMGRLFPVLDANLTVAPIDECTTSLVLTGAYRPPFAGIGAGLDRMLLHKVADATVRSLMARIAETVAPVPELAADAATSPLPRPGVSAEAEVPRLSPHAARGSCAAATEPLGAGRRRLSGLAIT